MADFVQSIVEIATAVGLLFGGNQLRTRYMNRKWNGSKDRRKTESTNPGSHMMGTRDREFFRELLENNRMKLTIEIQDVVREEGTKTREAVYRSGGK